MDRMKMSQHALIIGGTKGIGKAVARRFLEEGCLVSVIGRTEPIMESKNREIRYYQLDLAKHEKIVPVVSKIIKSGGRLNSLIFCQRYRGKDDDWSGELAVSLTATKIMIELLKNKFKASDGKSIVIISSIASDFIVNEQPLSYHVAKAALNQFIRYYAVALGRRGIRVNGVSPGTIIKAESQAYYFKNKPLHDLYRKITSLGRMITAEEVANVIEFLCSSKASAVTGQNIILDGGLFLRGQAALAREIKGL